MRCQRATEYMSLQLDDLLGPSERIELEAHLEECALCRQTWAAMQQVSVLFSSAPMVGPAPGFAQRVQVRIAKRRSRRQLWAGYSVLAAGLLLLMALPLTLYAGPISTVGRAVAQQPEMVQDGLGLLGRLGNIASSLMEAFWLLGRTALGLFPPALLVSGVALAGILVLSWAYLVSGRVGPAKSVAK